ncbi:unnamed protein product [Mycena citricolor]|uniref:HlyIII-domain-containing protein n=1 Tax=Mycena citricolor TaxID=2018698 RepID=A0AAD2GXW9_9AGAR|nr:unnamed protein product [Mycena citricolor]
MACNERTKLIEHRDEERHVGQHPHLDQEVAVALQKSEDGRRLLEYDDLPHSWKNNPFVVHGYRFPVLVASVFMAHNEFLNIQTHLLPLLFWVLTVPETIAETIFTVCVLICLASSVVWHTMAGCAHYETLVFCARLDYIGIGWLISACTANIVLYAFDDRILLQWAFLGLSFVTAVMGSILPFMDWFDRHHNRLWRLAFFISLACVTAIPLLTYWTLEGSAKMLHFLLPALPTAGWIIFGALLYAAHVPERFIDPSKDLARFMCALGATSHALWHVCIVVGLAHWQGALRFWSIGCQ